MVCWALLTQYIAFISMVAESCRLVVFLTTYSFIFFNITAALMSTVYEEQKDEDGFLYIQYSGESTFG